MAQKSSDLSSQSKLQLLTIEADYIERQYWIDLWRCRELLYFLAWRDISVRYKQSSLGIAWVVIRPVLTMLVFTIVFGKLVGLSSGTAHYPAMVLAAMLPWQLFASVITDSGNSIVNNGNMISKVYFPRLIIPLSTVVVSFADFLVSAVLLFALMAWYGIVPDWRIFTLPIFLAIGIAASIGIGLWIAALNVRYRDFRFIAAFGIQLGLYISPVGFSSAILPQGWRLLYSINPMVGVIDGFRWALLHDNTPLYMPGILLSIGLSITLLISAIIYFRKTEKSFADNI
jgi:lipopolysaccharide transport system permease protein